MSKKTKVINTRKTYNSLRNDGFSNVITSVGTNKDKRSNFYFYPNRVKHQQEVQALYRHSGIAKKLVNIIPNEMTREGIDINTDNSDEFIKIIKRLRLFPILNKAMKEARVTGSCLVVMGISDGSETLEEPVNFNNISDIESFALYDRYSFQFENYQSNTETKYYQVFTQKGNQKIHKSRCLYFDGEEVTTSQRLLNNGHGDSIFECLFDGIQNYQTGHDLISTIMQDVITKVLLMDGLNEALADEQDGEKKVIKKLELIEEAISVVNAVVLDSKDQYVKNTTNLTGLDKTIEILEKRLVAESNIPQTLLLGQNPQSSIGGQSGSSQEKDFYNFISQNQENYLRPILEKVLSYIGAMLNYFDEIPFIYRSLWQEDNKTKAETRNKQADTDKKYLDMGVLTEQEIRSSRFGDKEYSYETYIESDELPVDSSFDNINTFDDKSNIPNINYSEKDNASK